MSPETQTEADMQTELNTRIFVEFVRKTKKSLNKLYDTWLKCKNVFNYLKEAHKQKVFHQIYIYIYILYRYIYTPLIFK